MQGECRLWAIDRILGLGMVHFMAIIVAMLIVVGAVLASVVCKVCARPRHKSDKIQEIVEVPPQNGSTPFSSRPLSPSADTTPANTSLEQTPHNVPTDWKEEGSLTTREPGSSVTEPEEPAKGKRHVPAEQAPSHESLEETDAGSEAANLSSRVVKTGISPKEEIGSDATEVLLPGGTNQAQNPRPPEPEKRGGRARGTDPRSPERETTKRSPRAPKPEIVCWKQEQEWVLAVEMPESVQLATDLVLVQNGVPLLEDEYERGYWRTVPGSYAQFGSH